VSEQRPTRVQVTGPRTGRPRRTSISSEIDAQSPVGEIYMHSLMRSQLRLALSVVVMLAVSIGSLPLLFELRPGLRRAELLGVPVPWLLLGFGVYPVLVALAWVYVRRAERNERAFNDMVGGDG
jgi:putative solute:sodium symporter small subunit